MNNFVIDDYSFEAVRVAVSYIYGKPIPDMDLRDSCNLLEFARCYGYYELHVRLFLIDNQ